MDPSGLALLILQTLCQARFCPSILGQQLAIVHVNGVLQDDVVLIRDQDVMYEAKRAALQASKQDFECTCKHVCMMHGACVHKL